MFLCQMSGIPGTGKSTLARRICEITGSILLDVDTVKSSVMTTFENNFDFNFVSKVSYDVLFALANDNLELGKSIVIDSPCRFDVILERGANLSKKHNAFYKFVECYLDNLLELNNRRSMREIMPSQVSNVPISNLEFQNSLNELKRPIDHDYILIDTSQDMKSYIDYVIEYLNKCTI